MDDENTNDDDIIEENEDELTEDEIDELREKAKKAEELEAQLNEKEEELKKLQEKDINFSKFRNQTEEEKKKMLEKASKTEQMLAQEIEDMRNEMEEGKKRRMDEAKEAVLKQLAGDDKELSKQIELQEKEFLGSALTPQELEERYNKAYTLVKGQKPQVNRVFSYTPMADHTEPQKSTKRFTDTPEGKDLMEQHFPQIVELEDKDKK